MDVAEMKKTVPHGQTSPKKPKYQNKNVGGGGGKGKIEAGGNWGRGLSCKPQNQRRTEMSPWCKKKG